MGLYKMAPPLSGRMGTLWCLASIKQAAIVEYGCMGHMAYARIFLQKMGVSGAKLYSTHIGETDIALGDTTRLAHAIQQVYEKNDFESIFLLPSSVPEVVGVDLGAVAEEMAVRFPDKKIVVFSNGGFDLNGYKGVEEALFHLVKTFSKEQKRTNDSSYNIIGSCADIFNFMPDCAEIERIMTGAFSATKLCTMTSGTTISELENMGSAHFNIVLRGEGEKAAKLMEQKYGIPYLFMRPYGINGTIKWIEEIEEKIHIQSKESFVLQEIQRTKQEIETAQNFIMRFSMVNPEQWKMTLVGHEDVVLGIRDYANDCGFKRISVYNDGVYQTNPRTESWQENSSLILQEKQGIFMGSGEILRLLQKPTYLQIANPDSVWRHAYEPPLLGFRGATNLATIWLNEMMGGR